MHHLLALVYLDSYPLCITIDVYDIDPLCLQALLQSIINREGVLAQITVATQMLR